MIFTHMIVNYDIELVSDKSRLEGGIEHVLFCFVISELVWDYRANRRTISC